MVSIIIAARNEQYLEQTIRNVLSNARGEIEILVMLDGWIPEPQIHTGDGRVIFHHFQESIGQRQCINAGAKLAKGKYVMKLDAHCAVDEGFDIKLAQDCEELFCRGLHDIPQSSGWLRILHPFSRRRFSNHVGGLPRGRNVTSPVPSGSAHS